MKEGFVVASKDDVEDDREQCDINDSGLAIASDHKSEDDREEGGGHADDMIEYERQEPKGDIVTGNREAKDDVK